MPSVKIIRLDYTTCDVHQERDTINPRTHPFVMVKIGETTRDVHPLRYAQVLGAFHACAFHERRFRGAISPPR